MVFYKSIVCTDSDNGISKDNTLPWKIKEELNFFKTMTEGKIIIMGRKTYESIGKKLKNRINIVISSTIKRKDEKDLYFVPGVLESILLVENEIKPTEDVFIIGGNSIYSQFMKMKVINTIYLNQINEYYECDIKYDYSLHEKCDYILNHEMINYHYDKTLDKEVMVSYRTYKYYNSDEYKYLNLMDTIIKKGIYKDDRTGTGTLSVFGETIKYDVRNGIIPLLTTKKMFFRGIVEELLFFISGKTDSKILENKGVNIWKGNTSREFLDKRGLVDYKEGDMGPLYPFQLRHWGADYINCDTDYTNKGFDQLNNLINEIKTNPNSRRLLFSYWNPTDFTKTPIPTCFDGRTMVLTKSGYKKISELDYNDIIISHNLYERKINNMQIKLYTGDVYYIKTSINDVPIITTADHPFLVNNKWVKAKDISINDKLTLRRVNPGIGLKQNRLFMLLGYYYKLGRKFTILIKNRLCINKLLNLYKTEIKHIINTKYRIECKKMQQLISTYILEEDATNKLSFDLIKIGKMNIKYFMKGFYLACDLTSKRIVENNYSNALILQNMSYYCSQKIKINTMYEDLYELERIKNTELKNKNVLIDIESIRFKREENKVVYNIEVDIDNTYNVENIATHNCHILYQYYTNPIDNELSCSFYCRSQDYCLGTPFNIASATILLNIICKMTGYKPGYLIHNMGDTHIYSPFVEKFKKQISREAFNFPILYIKDKKNDIEKYVYEDFILLNYNSHKGIKADMIA